MHRLAVPCPYNERKNQCPGLMEAWWDAAGVCCEIVRGGEVSVGDEVRILTHTKDAARIRHGKRPAYFVRPSQRSAQEVRELRDGLRAARPRLAAADPAGCERIAAAYASVGLTFWPLAQRSDERGRAARGSGVMLAAGCASLVAVLVPAAAVAVAFLYSGHGRSDHDEL